MEEIQHIQEIIIEMERIKMQIGLLKSIVESERGVGGTIDRQVKRLEDSIKENDNKIRDLLYGKDRNNGLVMDVDRLKQMQKMINWLTGSVIVLIGKAIIDLLIIKK